jgi:hypothetical protein
MMKVGNPWSSIGERTKVAAHMTRISWSKKRNTLVNKGCLFSWACASSLDPFLSSAPILQPACSNSTPFAMLHHRPVIPASRKSFFKQSVRQRSSSSSLPKWRQTPYNACSLSFSGRFGMLQCDKFTFSVLPWRSGKSPVK